MKKIGQHKASALSRHLLGAGTALVLAVVAAGTADAQSNAIPPANTAATPAAAPEVTPLPPTVAAKREAANLPRTFPNQPGITGDWGGWRTDLHNMGVDVFGSFQTQTADITSGGKKQGTDSNFQVILGTNLDLDRLFGLSQATFTFAMAERFGENASNLAGTKVIIDGNFGEGENFRLANLSLKQNLFNGRIAYQIGSFPSAAEFDYSPLLCSFLNQGLCGHPNSLGADSNGFQNPPGAQLGARISFFLRPDLYLKMGVFEVDPPLFTTNNQGFRFDFHNATGAIALTELGWTPTAGLLGLPGHYKIGAYYDTSAAPDVVNAKIQHVGRYNGWLYADQMIWAFDPDATRGLYVFGNATDANRSNSLISTYFSTGFVALGPLASRPNDVLSVGWAQSNLNPREYAAEVRAKPTFGYFSAEKYLEISYKVQLTPWMFVTPDVQYLINPGAFAGQKFQNALVIGGATGISF